jgi:hypothetical protein
MDITHRCMGGVAYPYGIQLAYRTILGAIHPWLSTYYWSTITCV